MHLFRGHGWKWIGIFLLFIVPLLSLYVLEQQVTPLKNGFQTTASDFQFTTGDGHWQDFDPMKLSNTKVTGSYWFRTTLPDSQWRDPYMYLLFVPNAEIYLEDQLIYSFTPRYEHWEHPHLIKLPDDFAGQTLHIHIDFHKQTLYPGLITIDSPLNLIFKLIIQSGYRIILGIITLLTSIIGFVLYLKNKHASYLYFSLFALYIVQLCAARSWFLFGLLAPSPDFHYFQDVVFALGCYCFLKFYEALFGEGVYRIHRRLAQSMLAIFGGLLVTAWLFPAFHLNISTTIMQNGIAPLVMVTILISAIHTYWKKREVESFWFMAGFVAVGLSSLLYFLQPYIQWAAARISADWLPLSMLNKILYRGDRFLHGVFILLFCMVMIMVERIRSIYLQAQTTAEELAQLSDSLEQQVQERTRALEQTNLNLRSSMQETAEALAEVAVMEDRNRIAQDMHDRAGHSLTAALIQIEAVKMLAKKDSELALKKLEATRESVASGLESIRETVRMMRLDYEERSLIPSMQKLIQETQAAVGVQVFYDPMPLPDLDPIIKKTLYLALQEGLTNGIRHGKAMRFEFSLKSAGDVIHFQLLNNGEAYKNQEFGFGLSTMRERIERLNGTIKLTSSDTHACMLNIVIPLDSDSTERNELSDSNDYR